MANTKPHTLIRGHHTTMRDGVRVRLSAGAVFVPTDAELRAFKDRLKLAEQPVVRTKEPAQEPAGLYVGRLVADEAGAEALRQRLSQMSAEFLTKEQPEPANETPVEQPDPANEASGQAPEPEKPRHLGGGTWLLPDGTRFKGGKKAAFDAWQEKLAGR